MNMNCRAIPSVLCVLALCFVAGALANTAPAMASDWDRDVQTSIGGAKYFVSGELLKIDGEHYFVRDEDSGDAIRLALSKDSHLICAPGRDTGRQLIGKQAGAEDKAASQHQIAQGQKKDETAVGAGFVVGTTGCFKPGDKVKAEVSDLGTVLLMRYLPNDQPAPASGMRSEGESAGTGVLALTNVDMSLSTQDKPGQLDMTTLRGYPPKGYAIQPIPGGRLDAITDSPWLKASVKSHDGKTIGRIEILVKDAENGHIEYAEISLAGEGGITRVVPWTYFRPGRNHDTVVLEVRQYDLMPSHTTKDVKELAPSVDSLKQDTLTATAPADLQSSAARKAAREEAHMAARPATKEVPKGELIRGTVVAVPEEPLRQSPQLPIVVEDEITGRNVPLSVPPDVLGDHVRSRDDAFRPGDEIEIHMTPMGNVESINLLRERSSMQNPDG